MPNLPQLLPQPISNIINSNQIYKCSYFSFGGRMKNNPSLSLGFGRVNTKSNLLVGNGKEGVVRDGRR
jgi:hypothetical protein